MSKSSARSSPLAFWVRHPLGNRVTPCLFARVFKNRIAPLLSGTGLVFVLSATVVKPDKAAVFKPFSMFSLSSKPGSPKDTPLSNQPLEMCRLGRLITWVFFCAAIEEAIFEIIPFSISISHFFKWYLLSLSTMVADFSNMFIILKFTGYFL